MQNAKIEEKTRQFKLLDDPVSYVLTIHFSNMSKTYGNAFFRDCLETKLKGEKFSLDIMSLFNDDVKETVIITKHINNLFQTYGKEVIRDFYNTLYKI